jgi:O-phosphoseryl-tRNA(Sec) kinase
VVGGEMTAEKEDEENPQEVVVPTSEVDDVDVTARTCLLNMCGLPGAGKSTLARALAALLNHTHDDVRVSLVSFDSVEKQLALEALESSTSARSGGEGGGGGRDALGALGGQGGQQPSAASATMGCGEAAVELDYDAAVWRAARREAFTRLHALLTAEDDDEDNNDDEDEKRRGRRRRRHLVIADDNFYYASMRYQVHQLARRTAAAHVQLYVQVAAVGLLHTYMFVSLSLTVAPRVCVKETDSGS